MLGKGGKAHTQRSLRARYLSLPVFSLRVSAGLLIRCLPEPPGRGHEAQTEQPVGTYRVHEIKHDGYRLIVRPDGPAVRLYSRNAYDWTVNWRRSRLPTTDRGQGLDD
jgi:hypothetical protein